MLPECFLGETQSEEGTGQSFPAQPQIPSGHSCSRSPWSLSCPLSPTEARPFSVGTAAAGWAACEVAGGQDGVRCGGGKGDRERSLGEHTGESRVAAVAPRPHPGVTVCLSLPEPPGLWLEAPLRRGGETSPRADCCVLQVVAQMV